MRAYLDPSLVECCVCLPEVPVGGRGAFLWAVVSRTVAAVIWTLVRVGPWAVFGGGFFERLAEFNKDEPD